MDSLLNSSGQKKEGSDFFRSSTDASNRKSDIPSLQLPTLNLPKGGGAIKGIDEKFKVNSISGTSSFTIPIPFSPGRNGFAPSFTLSYNSGAGNSAFGIGWQMDIASISRKTENGLPCYRDADESDTFILSGAEDLVPVLELQGGELKKVLEQRVVDGVAYTITSYRPRIEGIFAKIEKWQNNLTQETYWRTITKNNLTSYYGLTQQSRITDPADQFKVFEWLLCRSHDDHGNLILLSYKKEDFADIANNMNEKNRVNNCTQVYPKKILYGNKQPYYSGDTIPNEEGFLFKAIFDYGEHDISVNVPQDIDVEKNTWTCRKDPFSSYRPGFEVRTYRRCERILMFHCFDDGKLPINPYLVRSLQLFYDETLLLKGAGSAQKGFSFLVKARQNGHLWESNTDSYSTKYLPEIELQYQQHEWNTTIQYITPDNLIGSPVGIDDKRYLWIDLYSEGIGGILTEQNDQWYYKSNLGDGQFTRAELIAAKPSISGLDKSLSIEELEGDGVKYLVGLNKEFQGFYKLNDDEIWESMKDFEQFPVLNFGDPNLKFIDLTGDGRSDILYSDDFQLRWYPSLGEKGFDLPLTICKEVDEEKGPAIVFADSTQSIFLADMSGDGLTDIVRIRNAEICYWPNMGYGHFGAKVNMDNAPVFDHVDNFNPAFLRLADIDGSGTTDIVYLGKEGFSVWMNLNGNEWSAGPKIDSFPRTDNTTDISVLDFLGAGTASIVYSSGFANQPLQYIDLMAGKKPALLIGYKNNCGKEVVIEYKSSTKYYLEDKMAGISWITKLPFPVHCISRLSTIDKIRETIYINTFSYRHGYYDFTEKEFRGFARVEQNDTESFSEFVLNSTQNVVEEDLFQPPVKTISWFHTGAYLPNEKLLHQCSREYFKNTEFVEYNMPEPILPTGLSAEEFREALRACKGLALRTEVYSSDGSLQQLFPYTASQTNIEIRLVQSRDINKYASFLTTSSESISYSYERIPADPRISHIFTLESDEFGNVTKSASAVYPRVKRPLGNDAISDKVWDEQNQMHIVYGEVSYTNDLIGSDIYRLRASYESKSYEVNGITQPIDFFLTLADLRNDIALASEIQYEDEFAIGLQKRLSSHGRIYFLKDDFSGSLPLGILSVLGIIYKKYQLVFTKNLITKYYAAEVTDLMLSDAGYVHSEGDHDWWTQTGTAIYSADPKADFYIPFGDRDVFGNEHYVQYDNFHLLIESSTDAITNTIKADNDYRVLAPYQITDPNLNRSIVDMDELGFVVKIAMMGKQGADEGDTLDDPTVYMEYDLFNWFNNGKPNYVHLFNREQHGSANPRWQESYAYSDGAGKVIMTKKQAEPGTAMIWNNVTRHLDEVNADPRWVGTGKTILNNKGNVVKKYEPYFSTTFNYESESALVQTGVTSVMYYDAIGRNIKTEFPDGSFSAIEFDSWYFKSFDVNDTVKDSQWYIDRGSPDPTTDPEPSDPETRAAWLTAKHYNTPSVFYADSIGRPFMTVADYGAGKKTSVYVECDPLGRYSRSFDQLNRQVSFGANNMAGVTIYSKTAEKGEKWVFSDVLGRIYKMWSASGRSFRFNYDAINRPVSSFVKEGASEWLYAHVVYGDLFADNQAKAMNLKGRVYQFYDQAGVITTQGVDFKGNVTAVTRRLTKEYKQTVSWILLDGLQDISAIQTAADPLLETETFNSSSTFDALNRPILTVLPDNSVVQPLYNEANYIASLGVKIRGNGAFVNFLETQSYDAKGQRQFVQYGNGTLTRYYYDPFTFRLMHQITKKHAVDSDSESIQNITYTFDPVGNITQISDDAQQTHFFQNAVVYPQSLFECDATYQLIKASGREHAGFSMDSQPNNKDILFMTSLPEANNSTAVRNYMEQYAYDDCGNVQYVRHTAVGASWTQRYHYEYEDDATVATNRLKASSLPGDGAGVFSATYTHDGGGNMISMPQLPGPNSMVWNFQSQLTMVDLGGGGKGYYVYGSRGSRCRKIIERPGGKKLERIYLGAVEIYRESQGGADPDLERYSLRIADNTGVIAQVDIKTIDKQNSDPDNILNKINTRFQYGNHLGSAMLELNESGDIISYEEYHPFGTSAYRVTKPGADLSLKRYRFCGKERDEETGFYYYGARYYAAWLGRWISSDPAGFVDGMNLFRYCSNNPVVLTDPNGMDSGRVTISGRATGHESRADIAAVLRKQGYGFRRMPTWVPNAGGSGGMWNFGDNNIYRLPRTSRSGGHGSGAAHSGASGGDPSSGGSAAGSSDSPSDGNPSGGSSGGASGGSPGGSSGGSPNGSSQGSPNGSPQGSADGSAHGTPGGSGSGGGGGERNFWNRGGATLLTGLLLLGAGLLTIFTAGAATPLLVLAAGAMATAGGIAVTTTSAIQLGASYSGATTAQQDREMTHTLNTVSSLSSPGGLVGGTIGAAGWGEQGLERGALIGNITELGYGATQFGISRFSSGAARELSTDTALIQDMAALESSVPRGASVIGSHGSPGMYQTAAGSMAPVGELAPLIQSGPQGNVTLLMCNVAHDPTAVQALSNQTGRSITAFTDVVGANNYSNVRAFTQSGIDAAGNPIFTDIGTAAPTIFTPQYLSPYLNLTPNIAAPGAAAVGGAQAQQ